MDLDYLRNQIDDELEGAQDYSAKAEECPDYAETFKDMSQQELGHAKKLMEMLKKKIDLMSDVYKHYSERI